MTSSSTSTGADLCGRFLGEADLVPVRYQHGTVGDLHGLAMPTAGEQTELWVMRPSQAAVAMGSAQRRDHFDLAQVEADGIDLAERRSGGGAVFVDPAATVWIDLLAPRTSSWWSSELTQNFLLIGQMWQRALRSLGVETEICETAGVRTDTARHACWAGVGWGELTIGDAKVVGLSQRRTRWGTRVQAMAVIDGSADKVAHYLPLDVRAEVADAIGGHQLPVSVAELERAVVTTFEAAH